MAFQQPTRQTMQRAAPSAAAEQDVSGLSAHNPQDQRLEESQTWVLFSPLTEVTATSYLTEDDHSLQTPGRSRLSDLGSLNTVARSASASAVELVDENHSSAVLSATADEESVGDDAELDSLDGHLPGFRSLPRSSQQHALSVFPAHDGLGSFHLDLPTLGLEAQEQIYQFERFNPRRVRRRLNSFDQVQFETDQTQVQEAEKRQRIETWRLEHSRIILEEVQRETRRRQKLKASSQQRAPRPEEDDAEPDNMAWHEQEVTSGEEAGESRGLLARMTCTVLRDVLGVDERLLSILLGDDLPSEEELSTTPRASQLGEGSQLLKPEEPWQVHVLERVSRELGLLVNQLKHPGAFSTYSRVQQMPLPYAGLPVIPESGDGRAATEPTTSEQAGEIASLEFKPTIHPAYGAVDTPSQKSHESDATVQEDLSMGNTFTQDEWEKEMDIKLVFRYLASRFISRSDTSAECPRHTPAKTQDTAAKAARVRQHHPLTSRSRPTERRAFKVTAPSSPVALRHHSSCASQSTRRSARRSSVSSRHYWDIGGSIGTGSIIASNGPMGSWGEI